ncbi:hypothetical protein DFJ58DRAFT_734525 [Suillus subalutaceus]|uniref:uncharacterized protein n=1 Tax=Suillus subalutaceus TaxID=48586 RepID=UPI001B879174|nr:uncharacterized protein DFJ58DRAFT_734525 [Suillus subalutaceus]KAG1837173.1 hypothetical protein DFJ58DRAFT_734525 [Suillus subalutaceus]
MKPELLRSRKKVYRKWLQNHGGKRKGKPPINLGQKWTYWSVVESLRKRELLKTIKYLMEMVNSLTEKEVEEATEMAAEWNKQGVPLELQTDIARRKGEDILWYVAKEMFKKARMRLFMMSAWKNEQGKLMVSSHDYNEEFGNGESFIKTCDWKVILPEWEGYVAKQFDGDIEEETLPPVRSVSWLEYDKLEDGKQQKKSGGKGKTGKRPGQKSTATVDDSSHSSEEDDILTHRQKLSKKTAKKPHKSRSWVYSEESSDGFSTPDASDKSSDDEMPRHREG